MERLEETIRLVYLDLLFNITKKNWKLLEKETHSVWKSQKKSQFNIASEASYIYILRGQKFINKAKNGPFWRVFENLKLAVKQCYQTCKF